MPERTAYREDMACRGKVPALGAALAAVVLAGSACGGDEATSQPTEDGSPPAQPSPTDTGPTSPAPTDPDPTKPSELPTETSGGTATWAPTEEPAPTSTEDPMPDNGPVANAVADLAAATGVDADDIQVVAHDQVTWRDGSLGCPEPGMMYTQALVDGYRIVLRAAGETVHYHGSAGGSPFRCDRPDPNGAIG